MRAAQVSAAAGLLMNGGRALAFSSPVLAPLSGSRSLSFDNLHTQESLRLVYAVGSDFVPQSLNRLNVFLRDHYSGTVGHMDPQLFDVLFRLRQVIGSRESFQVISGYRSPATNENLRETRAGGVAKHSLHMDGKAIDIRLPGTSLSDLHGAALSLQVGGVGFYPRENFVHIDTGRVRRWGG